MQVYVEKANEWKAAFQTSSLPFLEELVVRALYHYPIYITSTLIPLLQEEGGEEELIVSLESKIVDSYKLIDRINQNSVVPLDWFSKDALIAHTLGQACVHFFMCDDEWIRDRVSTRTKLLALLSVFHSAEQRNFVNVLIDILGLIVERERRNKSSVVASQVR